MEQIAVIPPWSHDDTVRFDARGRTRFRQAHGLEGKFVVMYSGNHSPCHPLDTLLEAARRLREERDVHFCFVGGGSEFARVKEFASRHRLPNLLLLPYQPLQELAGSLSAADLHVVVMGDLFVGLVHPCKVYNILAVKAPVLYIGPESSHVTDLFQAIGNPLLCRRVAHGGVDAAVRHIREARSASRPETVAQGQGSSGASFAPQSSELGCPDAAAETGLRPVRGPTVDFSKGTLLSKLVAELERGAGTDATPAS